MSKRKSGLFWPATLIIVGLLMVFVSSLGLGK